MNFDPQKIRATAEKIKNPPEIDYRAVQEAIKHMSKEQIKEIHDDIVRMREQQR
ncbi:MAG: hypothetical protein ACYCX4_00165 [Bacillota bacterium]